jgi:hypothetical protein
LRTKRVSRFALSPGDETIGGFQAVAHYAFWAAVLGWLAMTVGVAAKGI